MGLASLTETGLASSKEMESASWIVLGRRREPEKEKSKEWASLKGKE